MTDTAKPTVPGTAAPTAQDVAGAIARARERAADCRIIAEKEREELLMESAARYSDAADFYEELATAAEALAAAQAENARLREDAARLDWMQTNHVYVDAHMGPRAVVISVGWDGPFDIRAAIDAARAGGER
jgi:hypothetical protein